MYKCEILADSLSPQGHRLTTYKVTYPRIIHAEMCRHRILSRNSASSRAIPFKRMVQMVEEDPFIPIAWQKDHKGMQGTEYFMDKEDIDNNIGTWITGRDYIIKQAEGLNNYYGVTKQLCNRLLEPFLWHTEIITGTEWENFFKLRCPQYEYYDMLTGNQRFFKSKKDWIKFYGVKPLPKAKHVSKIPETYLEWHSINKSQAEIHIQAIAEMMWDAMNESTPKQLQAGEWHIPYGDKIDYTSKEYADIPLDDNAINWQDYAVKIATARCARISYETLGDNPKIDYEADIKLHDRLLEQVHMSPFEHCAKVMDDEEYQAYRRGKHEVEFITITENHFWVIDDDSGEPGCCRNFKGFIQYREIAENR